MAENVTSGNQPQKTMPHINVAEFNRRIANQGSVGTESGWTGYTIFLAAMGGVFLLAFIIFAAIIVQHFMK
jgi:hypothetical protein